MIDIDLLILFHVDGFDPFDELEDAGHDGPAVEMEVDSKFDLQFLQSSHSLQSTSSSSSSSSCFQNYHNSTFSIADSMTYDHDDEYDEMLTAPEGKTPKEVETVGVIGQITQSHSAEICRPKCVREGKVVKRDHPEKNFASTMRRKFLLH